jgi:outer membrane lipoprotein carrier protein
MKKDSGDEIMRVFVEKAFLFIAALSLCLGSAPSLHAAEPSLPPLKDILRNTEAYYQQLHAYTAHFRQRTTAASASTMSTEASGVLFYQKPRHMRWEYAMPERQVFVANQQHAWLYVPSDNQVSMFEGKAFFNSPIARTFFDGIFELRKHFEVNLDAKESTQNTAVLKLIPKQEDPHVESLRLWINLPDYRVVSVETRDAIGNINRLVIEGQKEALSLDPRLFHLDIPNGAIVTDAEGRELSSQEIGQVQKETQSQ